MTWLSGWSAGERAVLSLAGGSVPRSEVSLDRGLLDFAIRERIAGVLSQKISDSHLDSLFETVVGRNIMALSQAKSVLSVLGTDVVPLKGIYFVDRFYALGERDMGDLDFLVPLKNVPALVGSLEKEGYRSSVPLDKVLAGSGSYLNSISLYQDSSFPIHLHWHVINASLPLFMVRVSVEELWEESVPAVVGGIPVRGLAPHHLLVTIAEHALKHSYEALIHLVDLDRIVRSGVDISKSFSCARRWGISQSLQMGLYLCSKMLGTPVKVRMPGGLLSRMIIHSMRMNHRWPGIGSLGYLSMARGGGEKVRFLLGTFSPPSADVESFGKKAGLHRILHRGWRAISGGRRLLGGKA